jgi:hypothetical protein
MGFLSLQCRTGEGSVEPSVLRDRSTLEDPV